MLENKMLKKYGKRIDSSILKKDLNKSDSVKKSRLMSLDVKGGVKKDNCPICEGTKFKDICTIYEFTYVECENCGVAFVINAPESKELEKIYASEYYSSANKVLYANDSIIEYRIENIAKPKVDYIFDNIKNEVKSWLDIGCGTGEILNVVQDRGLKIIGVETNDSEREYAKTKLNIEVQSDYIDETTIGKYVDNCDVVSLFSILEHIPNQHSIIKAISSAQNTGNYLVIEVPHFPSISVASQITFPEEVNRMMHPPLHLFLYSLKSLEVLLKKYNYKINNAWYFGQDFYEFFSTLSLYAKDLNNSLLHNKISELTNDFQEVIDKHELSDEILIIAEKL